MYKKPLTKQQQQVYDLRQSGLNQNEIGLQLEMNQSSVCRCLHAIRKKGFEIY